MAIRALESRLEQLTVNDENEPTNRSGLLKAKVCGSSFNGILSASLKIGVITGINLYYDTTECSVQ